MKIEQLLVQHFYIVKQVTLQGIGTFRLAPDFITPIDSDKEIVLPENAVSFQFNPKATEDEALISYIVQQTRKIRPLASADLESYLTLASQFLNIGKPLKIEGIGMLEKNQLGEYLFSQGQFINTKVQDATVQLKEKAEDNISFANLAKPSGKGKQGLAILSTIIAVGIIIWGVWYFLNKNKNVDPITKDNTEQIMPVLNPKSDTAKSDTPKILQQKADTISPALNYNNGYNFKIVIKNYPSLFAAQKAFTRLTGYGHKLLLYTADSITYKIAMPFTRPVSDTAFARDSVRKLLFGGNPYIEIK